MKLLFLLVAAGCGLASPAFCAESAQWTAFDPAVPQHFIDMHSIVHISKEVVRYWDRGGAYPNGDGPDSKFPQYGLYELNCATHMTRMLRWDIALEAGLNPRALKEKAKFAKATAQLGNNYPGEWESLDPSAHQYALLEFVCRERK